MKLFDAFHEILYLKRVLKSTAEANPLEAPAKAALQELLARVPSLKLRSIEPGSPVESGFDLVVRLEVGARRYELICEVKTTGQLRQTRAALLHLRELVRNGRGVLIPCFIAPYLSPAARALCQTHEVSFLDLEGNCRLAFDGVYIERTVATRPHIERHEFKSLFTAKASQILRVMLRDPRRPWRVAALAKAADVSVGHVSNVRAALLEREWAEPGDEGLLLSHPNALLDAWRDAYQGPAGRQSRFYTTLHGNAFEEAARRALRAANEQGAAMFASFSAAKWMAPYARVGTHFFYADEPGGKVLEDALKLSSTTRGENVVITYPDDLALFSDGVERPPGVLCTSPVQTFLDLYTSGERGHEAADHLRQEMLRW